MKDPVKDELKRFGLFEQIGAEHFFSTVGEAVKAYVAAFEVAVVGLGRRRAEARGAERGLLRLGAARLE